MVAKISVGKSLYGALAYNGEKINKEQGKLLATNKIYNDGTGTVEEVRGNVLGRKYNGLVYSVVDESGNKAGNPFKSVLYGKSVGYETVQGKFVRSRQELTEQRGQSNPFELPSRDGRRRSQIKDSKLAGMTKRTVLAALDRTYDKDKFIADLKAKGIDTVFRHTEDGRIYGATFIDQKVSDNKTVLHHTFRK